MTYRTIQVVCITDDSLHAGLVLHDAIERKHSGERLNPPAFYDAGFLEKQLTH